MRSARVGFVVFLMVCLLLVPATLAQAAPKPVIAVVQSEYTASAYAQSNSNYGAYFGAVEMILFQANISYDVITDKDVEDGKLISEKYKLAIMAANNAVSAKEAAQVTEFVKAGGALFTGYNVGLRNEQGGLTKDFGIADVLGLSFAGTANGTANGNYGLIEPLASEASHPFFAGLPKELPFSKHYAVLVSAKPEVKVLARWLNDKGNPAGPEPKNGAIFLNGKVVYAGGNIWDPQGSSDTPELNKLIVNVINSLLQ